MPRPTRIRIDLSPIWHGEELGRLEDLKTVLDMLRYSGLLGTNVSGSQRIIEYNVPTRAAADRIIDRWRSFAIAAEVIDAP